MTDASTRPLALVTGASSGIGLELARQFLTHGFDVVVTAEDDIAEATAGLAVDGAAVIPVRADLEVPGGAETVLEAVAATGRPLAAAALNAGFANGGRFVDIPLADEIRLIAVNITAPVHFAKRLLPAMIERGEGRILFTSSVAATMPGPYYATYAASKAFVQSFAEAVRHEVKDTGVTVTALLPGPTDTDFFAAADMLDTPVAKAKKDDPADVAKDGFEALMAGKDSVVAGSLKNKAQVVGGAVLSDTAKARMHAGMTKPESV
ncbi:SDR family NAD(P)-dependent oxidoreductase [Nakamurella deserti]|uniref:SDR family NAD(P)-dependent oxidoreductase n=1 Tax=Nakamurella deserti TaxID=2164074 RepID=UPI000DBE4509|nr:SDR family NAD(P)-dependent oxidoreductase [Nakamurella deserti]